MAEKTMVPKTLVKEIKKTKISPLTTRRIRLAIEDINTTPIDTLCKSGKVRKLNLQSEDNVYIYRAGVRERVIFSIKDKAKIVRDVITADELIKMKNG